MGDPIVLPVGVSIAIVAFLLSLLPAGFFLWLWYLRSKTRSVPATTIAMAFGIGLILVEPAYFLESKADQIWSILSPATEHYYSGAILPLLSVLDIGLPALATFFIVAPIEEGLRYVAMRLWMRRSKKINQVFDGLLIGVAVGLGFSTLENTLYFHDLLNSGQYDTLVFVFFLRFIISTLAHVCFAGIMGTLIAQGTFEIFRSNKFFIPAFIIPWFLHGLFDLLLGIGYGFYAICILIAALFVLISWTMKREFSIIHRQDGAFLETPHAPENPDIVMIEKALGIKDSPWNINAPWLNQSKSARTIYGITHQNTYE
jgi:RsiW-degrading membrane proteinase PrsW (M82 family)